MHQPPERSDELLAPRSPAAPQPTGAAWPYVLPMAVFLGFVLVGGLGDRWHPWAYAVRTLVVGGLLVWLWPKLRFDVHWTHWRLGIAVGVIGAFQWIGTDKALQAVRGRFPDDWSWGGLWNMFISGVRPGEGYDPQAQILEPAGMFAFVAFLAIRTLGPAMVVPVMEELFWRNWLWRSLASPNNWRLAAVGEADRTAVIGTCLAFALVHPQRVVSVLWAALIAWLLIRTQSLGACIVAHATTNLLLAAYVLTAALAMGHRGEWYFW